MPFKNDVFISYAHIDNETPDASQKGWISAFHRALEVRLAQLRGEKPAVFRDPKLQGNDLFGERLTAEIPASAALVSVFSPRYLKSEWCRRELDEFHRASAGSIGLFIGTRSRLFKVIKTPIPLDLQPPEVREVLGYEFYSLDPETGRPRELAPDDDAEIRQRYWAKLNDLAYDLCQILEELEAGLQGEAGTATTAERVTGETVYVAPTTYDLQDEREALVRDLRQHGHTVLPERPLPLYAKGCAAYVAEELARCSLSIHLIGRLYGVVPEGTTLSMAELQHELAAERSRATGLPRLVWTSPGLEPADEAQGRFLEALRTDPRYQTDADLLEVPFTDLQLVVRRRLQPEEAAPTSVAMAGEPSLQRIYLICESRDADAATPLEDHLFDRGFEVTLPIFDGDETEIREEHEESLRDCDGVLIYWGHGPEIWQRRMLREIKKSAGYGRRKAPPAAAIYVASPALPAKERLRTREAAVLRGGDDFRAAELEPWLRELER